MSEIQVVTLLATLLGLIATVLNLVAFVREKDKSHTRAGFKALFALLLLLALGFMPRYAPSAARALVSLMPTPVATAMQPWLSGAPTAPAVAEATAPRMLGSFTIEIQRNIFGGIGALVSNFQFSNLSDQAVRVTAYHIRITGKIGEPARSYDRVLEQPVVVPANGVEKAQVELDAEIRDQWVAREDLEAAERGALEMSWECADSTGRHFVLRSSNG